MTDEDDDHADADYRRITAAPSDRVPPPEDEDANRPAEREE